MNENLSYFVLLTNANIETLNCSLFLLHHDNSRNLERENVYPNGKLLIDWSGTLRQDRHIFFKLCFEKQSIH